MCDSFLQSMDHDDNGDLTDIVRVGGHSSNADIEPFLDDDANWQVDHLLSNVSDFGDPFADLQDPLLKPYVAAGGATGFDHDGFGDRFQLLTPPQPPTKVVEQEIVKGAAAATNSILSKVHQISLSPLLPRLIRPTPVAAGEITMKVISAGCPTAGAADHYGEAQISPHRATPGNKRRKGQAKRVVYVPAPAAASNRPSGEVVPSDLWAWRKYGQKPIKGSPYPRGYYRCSSSKGCSARKQVERSRTDPNMLVVTYTAEHNHPWPTQRNALAGSVRSLHSKSTKPPSTDTVAATDPIIPDAEAPPVSAAPFVNEEIPVPAHFDQSGVCYKSMIPEADQPDDFFSDLAELESDPMSLIFSEGFTDSKTDAAAVGKATADPLFAMFD